MVPPIPRQVNHLPKSHGAIGIPRVHTSTTSILAHQTKLTMATTTTTCIPCPSLTLTGPFRANLVLSTIDTHVLDHTPRHILVPPLKTLTNFFSLQQAKNIPHIQTVPTLFPSNLSAITAITTAIVHVVHIQNSIPSHSASVFSSVVVGLTGLTF